MKDKPEKFEVADAGDPRSLIKASQRAALTALQDIIASLRADAAKTKVPGLTWDQIEYLIEGFKKKEPVIIEQEHEQ